MPPPGVAMVPVQVTLLPESWMPASQQDPPPASNVGRPMRAGDILVLPLIVIRPVATMVTPINTGDDSEMLTSPAT